MHLNKRVHKTFPVWIGLSCQNFQIWFSNIVSLEQMPHSIRNREFLTLTHHNVVIYMTLHTYLCTWDCQESPTMVLSQKILTDRTSWSPMIFLMGFLISFIFNLLISWRLDFIEIADCYYWPSFFVAFLSLQLIFSSWTFWQSHHLINLPKSSNHSHPPIAHLLKNRHSPMIKS